MTKELDTEVKENLDVLLEATRIQARLEGYQLGVQAAVEELKAQMLEPNPVFERILKRANKFVDDQTPELESWLPDRQCEDEVKDEHETSLGT